MKNTSLIIAFIFSSLNINAQNPVFDWVKTAGSTHIDRAFELVIDQSTGDIYVTGSFTNTVDFDPGTATLNLTAPGASNDDQIFLAKYNAAGDLLWAKGIGGDDSDFPQSMVLDQVTHEVYIAGRFRGTSDFDPGPGITNLVASSNLYDLFVTKLDSAGNLIWAKPLQGRLGHAYGLALDGLGSVVVLGSFTGPQQDFDPGPGTNYLVSNGSDDVYVCKLSTSGNFIWAKSFGAVNPDYGDALITDNTGNIYISGKFYGSVDFDPSANTFNLFCQQDDAYFVKLDPAGNLVFAKQIGGPGVSRGYNMVSDAAQNILLVGLFTDTTDFDPGNLVSDVISSGQQDIFVLKLDAGGNFIWVKTFGGAGTEIPAAIKLDASENIYLTGNFAGDTDLDPGPALLNYTSLGLTDGFISVLSSQGNLIWHALLAGPELINPQDLELDNTGNIYSVGSFSGTVDFDPDAPVTNFTSAGGDDIYFHKITSSLSSIQVLTNQNKIKLSPNPTSNFIKVENLSIGTQVNITDVTGKNVRSFIAGEETMIFNLEQLNKGIYLIHFTDSADKISTAKIVVE